MINIDKSDELYKYLSALKVDNIDEEYLDLAQNGRYKLNDVRQYYREMFQPSQTEDVDEKKLETILDYYVDVKSVKKLNTQDLKRKLAEYKQTKNAKTREFIINSQLKDILYLCLNYSTMHKDVDLQDLVQIANIGLLEAVEKYDPESRVDFKDYLIFYIRRAVKDNFKEKTNG